jgi:hypothetical protein
MRGFSMGRFTPVPDVIVPDAIFGLFSLSIRHFTDQSLTTDYAQKAVFRSLIMLGMGEEEASCLSQGTRTFAEAPMPPPTID